jgi:hypothetical protein
MTGFAARVRFSGFAAFVAEGAAFFPWDALFSALTGGFDAEVRVTSLDSFAGALEAFDGALEALAGALPSRFASFWALALAFWAFLS